MAVAYDALSSTAGGTGNMAWSHTPAGTPKGAIVFICQAASNDDITAVTYGGKTMNEVTGSPSIKATAESGGVYAYFLGTGLPTGKQTIAITAGGSARVKGAAAYTITAAGDTKIQNINTTIRSQAVANPSATLSLGGNSCFCCEGWFSGQNAVSGATALSGWTNSYEVDLGLQIGGAYKYNTIGTTDVTMGWTQTSDDAVAIGLAITEDLSVISSSIRNIIFKTYTISNKTNNILFRSFTTNTTNRNILFYGGTFWSTKRNLIFKGKTTSSTNRNIIFNVTGISYNITGTITEYFRNNPVAGVKVTIQPIGGVILSSAMTDNAGAYTLSAMGPASYIIRPKKYDWDFIPQYHQFILSAATVKSFVQSSESLWWGATAPGGKPSMSHRGKEWAFRQLIQFPSPHPTLTKDYTIKIPFQTGNTIRIGRNGYYNEAIQHSVGDALGYYSGKTHVVWTAAGGYLDYSGATYDWNTNTWTEHGIVASGYPTTLWDDSHNYPSMCISQSGNIYLCKGPHDGKLYIIKSKRPNVMTAFPSGRATGTVVGVTDMTYIRMIPDDKDGIYWCGRHSAANPVSKFYIGYQDAAGINYGPYCVAKYPSANGVYFPSIYIGGFNIDRYGTFHVVLNWFEGYLTYNHARSISYIYSPKYPGSTAGIYWYNIWGHTIGVSAHTANVSPTDCPVSFQKDGRSTAQYSHHVIYSWSSAESSHSSPAINRYYHTNTHGLFFHPTRTINNGKHIIQAPYFTCHAYRRAYGDGNDIMSHSSEAYVCLFDTNYRPVGPGTRSGKDNAIDGWVVHTVSASTVCGNGAKIWKGRHYGAGSIDATPTISVFGFILPQNTASGYYGAELRKWYSTDGIGHRWAYEDLSANSGYGIGMIGSKIQFSNNVAEYVYCRGYDIYYYSEYSPYDRIKRSGNDIRIVYSSASSNAIEIDRISNIYNYSSSLIYFQLKHTIPMNWVYHTQGNYYLYYGRYTTAQSFGGPNPDISKTEPTKTMLWYEGFERYKTASSLVNKGGWQTQRAGYVSNSMTVNTLGVNSGDNVYQFFVGANAHTAYHSLSTAQDVVFKTAVWYAKTDGENPIGNHTAMCRVRLTHSVAGNNRWVEFAACHTGKAWGFRSSPWSMSWVDSSISQIDWPRQQMFHDMIIYCSSANGISFQTERGKTIFSNSDSTKLGYGLLNLHTVSGVKIYGMGLIIDSIKYYKSLSTPNPYDIL